MRSMMQVERCNGEVEVIESAMEQLRDSYAANRGLADSLADGCIIDESIAYLTAANKLLGVIARVEPALEILKAGREISNLDGRDAVILFDGIEALAEFCASSDCTIDDGFAVIELAEQIGDKLPNLTSPLDAPDYSRLWD